jgi:hypothetical protein
MYMNMPPYLVLPYNPYLVLPYNPYLVLPYNPYPSMNMAPHLIMRNFPDERAHALVVVSLAPRQQDDALRLRSACTPIPSP